MSMNTTPTAKLALPRLLPDLTLVLPLDGSRTMNEFVDATWADGEGREADLVLWFAFEDDREGALAIEVVGDDVDVAEAVQASLPTGPALLDLAWSVRAAVEQRLEWLLTKNS